MNSWSGGYITDRGIRLHYYRTGGDKPPLVINHGAGDDGLCWTRIVKEIEADYDIILPDARGHGKSDTGQGNYSTQARVGDLASLIQALDLDRPVIGGHSMGADTCLHFAAAYPDRVRGIFLEDPPIILPEETIDSGQQSSNGEKAGKSMARMMLSFKLAPKFIGIHWARKMNPTYPEDEIIPWLNSKKEVSFDFLNALPRLVMDHTRSFDAFKKVAVPVLLFTGDQEKMAIVSPAAARAAVNLNDKIVHVHLVGADHSIRRTRFDGYVPALREFLAKAYHP